MTTIPVLDPVTDINDSDLVMVTNAQGLSYTINGAELEKRNKIIIASNTTVTGVPLKAGRVVRIYFDTDITANDGNTVMQINYNSVNYYVKVPKDGALSNFVAHAVGNTYKYVQAHTTLEFLVVGNQQNGFQFVIIGNPVVISTSDYTIYADGSITYKHNYGNIADFSQIIEYQHKDTIYGSLPIGIYFICCRMVNSRFYNYSVLIKTYYNAILIDIKKSAVNLFYENDELKLENISGYNFETYITIIGIQ